jgi:hypothetical protein
MFVYIKPVPSWAQPNKKITPKIWNTIIRYVWGYQWIKFEWNPENLNANSLKIYKIHMRIRIQ